MLATALLSLGYLRLGSGTIQRAIGQRRKNWSSRKHRLRRRKKRKNRKMKRRALWLRL
jgi:hypothetical protein